jgi:hypothetical protein
MGAGINLYYSINLNPPIPMKQKGLIITAILFFLLVNTTYFWEIKLGGWGMLVIFILVLVFLILSVNLLRQLFYAIKEKYLNRHRLLTVCLLTVILGLTLFFPSGLFDFDKLMGKDLLVAQREGAVNCLTTLKLKENGKFIERTACFGLQEIKGNYKMINDTIYFENVESGRNEDTYYRYAVIRPSEIRDNKHFDIIRFKDITDTTGHKLWIIKNDLHKPMAAF